MECIKRRQYTNRRGFKKEVLLSDKDSLYRFTSKKKMLYTLINIVSTSFFTALFGALAIIVIGVCKLMLQLDALGTWGQYFLFAILITMGAMDIPQKWAGFLLFTSYLFTLTSSKTPYGIFGK